MVSTDKILRFIDTLITIHHYLIGTDHDLEAAPGHVDAVGEGGQLTGRDLCPAECGDLLCRQLQEPRRVHCK